VGGQEGEKREGRKEKTRREEREREKEKKKKEKEEGGREERKRKEGRKFGRQRSRGLQISTNLVKNSMTPHLNDWAWWHKPVIAGIPGITNRQITVYVSPSIKQHPISKITNGKS
jgi:hypothetical protein